MLEEEWTSRTVAMCNVQLSNVGTVYSKLK